MEDLSEEHQALYTWIDEIPLSRQKKHVARDFSDGGNAWNWWADLLVECTGLLFILFAEVPNLVSSKIQSDELSTYVNL